MGRKIDLLGQRFGRLIVIEEVKIRLNKRIVWLCRCDCGNFTRVRGYSLRSGFTKSCGCLMREVMQDVGKRRGLESKGRGNPNYKHGGKGTRLHRIWLRMKSRCSDSNCTDYKRYGGRGIKVCPEWKNNFIIFRDWALGNGYKPELTIDKINNNGNYEPSNCQWVTRIENIMKYWEVDRPKELGK